MDRSAIWFFDFVSPFAYLQSKRISEFENTQIKPVLFAGLLNHFSHKGPAEIESKRVFTYRHVAWTAKKLGIDFKFPPEHPFNPLQCLRLAIALKSDLKVIQTIFDLIWKEGLHTGSPEFFAKAKEATGFQGSEEDLKSSSVKEELKANGALATEKGVFGVPTILIDDQIFWGLDATDFALEFHKNANLLTSAPYTGLDQINVGASRK